MRNAEEILNEILHMRGLISSEEIAEFLSDKPRKTYDPFLLLNLEAGVDLLLSEINRGTRICIYGDYDADGVTSICILSSVMGMLTDNLTYYIPSRFEEGYGLNIAAINRIHEDGVGLLLTVDCGSVSYEEVEHAKALGIKVIVTDHHSINDVKADCLLINPKQKACPYPFKELAGCGVAFKLAQGLQQKAGLPKQAINDVLDLVAIGTVGDVVSLMDENRTIVKYGLNKINGRNRRALSKLSEAISLPWITAENIAFGIAPHINAAGRMAHAQEAVKLLIATDEQMMDRQVDRLVNFNRERKKKQEDAYRRGMEMVAGGETLLLLHMPDIHEGIGGIVAGKIKESTNRPVIIVTPSGDGYLKGTGRSIEAVDIYRLLKRHAHLFIRFGGHKSACGFLMPEENLTLLEKALAEEMQVLLEETPQLFDCEIRWDMKILPEEIGMELALQLERLEPVGQGNPKPVFLMERVRIHQPRFMGEDSTHVRFTAVSENSGRAACVFFKRAQEQQELICGADPVDLVGTIEAQDWRGHKKVQFIVEEIWECR